MPPGFGIVRRSDNSGVSVMTPSGRTICCLNIDHAETAAWDMFEQIFGYSKGEWLATESAARLFPELLSFADAMARGASASEYISWSNSSGVDDVRRGLKGEP